MSGQEPPRAFRPLRAEVLALAATVASDDYIRMSEQQFVGAVLRASGGVVSPQVAADWYSRLMADAGLGTCAQNGHNT